jgi:homoserine dehydrogenase
MINVAIMGHGVVGSGVAEILLDHNNLINQKRRIELGFILLKRNRRRKIPCAFCLRMILSASYGIMITKIEVIKLIA